MPGIVSYLERSPAMVSVSMPCFERRAWASSSSPCFRAVMATFAPTSPRASAICKPSPREPPVINAVLPERSKRSLTVMCNLSLLGLAGRGWHGGEDAAPTQDALAAHPQMAAGESEPFTELLHVDTRLDPVPGARDVGEVGGEIHGHHGFRRRTRHRDDDSQRAVGQRHQHATVRDAPRVEVLFLDAHADHQALAFIL